MEALPHSIQRREPPTPLEILTSSSYDSFSKDPPAVHAENRQEKWNAYYSKADHAAMFPENWIEKHLELFPRGARIIELGCGVGFLSELLYNAGFSVTATDIAPAALAALTRRVRDITTLQLDLEQPRRDVPYPAG